MSAIEDRLSGCTDAQRRAILHDTGPAVVVAGPGSGKTFVITHRIRHLINDLGVSPEKILTITFTRAAARQMRERAIKLTPGSGAAVFGTFHSVYYNILRQSGGGMFDIVPDREKRRIFLEIARNLGRRIRDQSELFRLLQGDISRYKTRLRLDEQFIPTSMDEDEFRMAFMTYEKNLKSISCIDFDDILLQSHKLLLRNGAVREKWRQRFEYIQVDEFQDIDELQFATLRLLLGKEENLFVVGDDDQSIYGFRGGSPDIMLDMERRFPTCRRVVLDVNFRCAQNICSSAGRLIRENSRRFEKKVVSSKDGGRVELSQYEDQNALASYLVRVIRTSPPCSRALLTRTGEEAERFCKMLREQGVDCSLAGRREDPFSHFVVQDMISYVKLALGKGTREDLLRIMNRPMRYISRLNMGEGTDLSELKRLQMPMASPFIGKLERDLERIGGMKPYGAITYIMRAVGYEDFLAEYEKERGVERGCFTQKADWITERSRSCQSLEEWLAMSENGQNDEISNRVKTFVARVEEGFSDNDLRVDHAVLPSGRIREVDVFLKGRGERYKMNLDRGVAVQVEDAVRMKKYLDQNNLQAEYVDIRVEGRAFYK